jgi:hypothetical protein
MIELGFFKLEEPQALKEPRGPFIRAGPGLRH